MLYASPRRVKSPRSKAPSTDHSSSKIPSAEYSSTPRDAVVASQHMQRERNISSSTRAASINKEIPNYIGSTSAEYTPKIPSMCRPRPQQQLSPEKVPPGSRTQYPSPTRSSSYRKAESSNSSLNPPIVQEFNLSTSIDPLESLRRPATSSSPYRWCQQMEGVIREGFKSLQLEVSTMRRELGDVGSRVDNLSTSVNILTNMQGILVEKVVDFKLKKPGRPHGIDGGKH